MPGSLTKLNGTCGERESWIWTWWRERRSHGHMDVDDDGARTDVIGRLFYLVAGAAEDAAALACAAQSSHMCAVERRSAAAKLRAAGEMIEIVSSAIELIESSTAS